MDVISKAGLIFLVLLFGAFAFVGGALAPASWQKSLADFAAKFSNTTAKTAVPQNAGTTTTSSAAAPGKEEPPLRYESLLVPTPLPSQASYGLQIDLYENSADAEALVKRAKEAGYPAQTIPVVDRTGARWLVVAAGKYASLEDARTARDPAARQLSLAQLPVVILLPTAPVASGNAP